MFVDEGGELFAGWLLAGLLEAAAGSVAVVVGFFSSELDAWLLATASAAIGAGFSFAPVGLCAGLLVVGEVVAFV